MILQRVKLLVSHAFLLISKPQFDVVSKFLTSRYENARQFRGSRKNYQFIPNGGNILMSRISGSSIKSPINFEI